MAKFAPNAWDRRMAKQSQVDMLRTIQAQDAAMKKILVDAQNDFTKILRGIKGSGVGAVVRRAQYALVREQIALASRELWVKELQGLISDNLDYITQMSINAQKDLLAILNRSVGASSAILAESMRHTAMLTLDGVRARMLNNINLSKSVYDNAAFMSGKIDAIVNEGILLGQSAAEIAKGVEQYISPNVMGGTSYAAKRLGRTEIANAARTTSVESYKKSPYVKGVAWNLSGSHPGDDDCNALAESDDYGLGGGIYPVDAVPFAPHPNCFCYVVPVTPTPEEFANNLEKGQYDCG